MPKAASSTDMGTRRYAAAVEKGENAWRREWSGFMSGVNLKDLRKGGSVVLPKNADLDTDDVEAGGNYSYLFASPAEKKAARLEKQREADEKRRKEMAAVQRSGDPLAHLSKHERTLHEARKRGLQLDGMSRKEVRQFLHLTISREQAEAERQQTEFRPHELMDERLQWYQQGPHPVDLIAEKLIARKAQKKGKQLGLLRYNYLLPHPSWIVRRAQRRRESVMVGLGHRCTFDDEGNMRDVFGNIIHMDSLVKRGNDSCENTGKQEQASDQNDVHRVEEARAGMRSSITADVLFNPQMVNNSFVRSVVQNRSIADAIKNANLTTSYLSSSIIQGPSLGIEDTAVPESCGTQNTESKKALSGRKDSTLVNKRVRGESSTGERPKQSQKRSNAPSFEL